MKCKTIPLVYPQSYIPALARCIIETQDTKGPVLELGIGNGSTPFLKEMCRNRYLLSLEDEELWYSSLSGLDSPQHKIEKIVWGTWTPPADIRWDVVFVDQVPGHRRRILEMLKGKAKLFVIHDTEQDYADPGNLFKYRIDYRISMPRTSVVSDEVDVTQWDFPLPDGHLEMKNIPSPTFSNVPY